MNKFAIGHMATRARRWAAPAVAGLSTLAANVYAAIPAEVTADMETAKTDGSQMAIYVLLAVIAIFAIKFLRRGL